MASEQLTRESVTEERDAMVEKNRVPNMTTHFESLVEKAREEQHSPLHTPGKNHSPTQTPAAKNHSPVRAQNHALLFSDSPEKEKRSGDEEEEQPKEVKTTDQVQTHPRNWPSLEELSNLQHNSMDVIAKAAEDGYEKAKEMGASALQKAKEAKDVVASKGQSAVQFASEKAKVAKDTTADYVGPKATAARDVVMESGKEAVEYVGKVKDQALEATQYTVEKVAGVGKTAVGYAGGTVSAAKDLIASNEVVAAEYASARKKEQELEARKTSHDQVNLIAFMFKLCLNSDLIF